MTVESPNVYNHRFIGLQAFGAWNSVTAPEGSIIFWRLWDEVVITLDSTVSRRLWRNHYDTPRTSAFGREL